MTLATEAWRESRMRSVRIQVSNSATSGRAALTAYRQAPLGRFAVERALDVEQRVDAPHRFEGEWRDRRRVLATPLAGGDVGEFVELAPDRGPSRGLRSPAPGPAPAHTAG